MPSSTASTAPARQAKAGTRATTTAAEASAVAPPDGRTRYSNGDKRRQEIIDAAIEVFAQQGFFGLSLRQLADAIGVSHTLLRHHFGSKENIFEAVLVRREELERPWRDEILATHGFIEAIPLIMEHNATIRGLIQLDTMMHAEAVNPEHPAHAYIRDLDQRFRESLCDSIIAEQKAGTIRPELSAPLIAAMLASLIEGVQGQWLLDPSIDMAAVLHETLEALRTHSPDEN